LGGALSSTRHSILIVEDDFVLRAALAELLVNEGYGVLCAANGIEALAILRAAVKPAVILLDLVMPYMDGLEFRELQKALPGYADVPIVVITASGASAAESVRLGLDRMFFKPVNTPRLLNTIKELTPKELTPPVAQ
jgi:CheY-like chemotaxis protein